MCCPVCRKELKLLKLLDELVANVCLECMGKWIRSRDFIRWKEFLNVSKDQFYENEEYKENRSKNENYKNKNFPELKSLEKIDRFEKISLDKNIKIIIPENKDENDINKVKMCPDCERILIKYRVSKELNFHIENCGTCGGVWLDSNKWNIIFINNLHLDLYEIFTEYWQKNIRSKEKLEFIESRYNKIFGENDYEKLKEIKKWIESKEKKRDIIDYLVKIE